MGRASKSAVLRAVEPKVLEFVEVAGIGDLRALKKLIKAGKVEIDDDVDGVTALMKACENGQLAVVEELLVNGAGMWCVGPTDDPKTPFMWAAHHGQLDIIRYFVEEVGLDVMAMNKGAGKSGRKTAVDYALDAGNNLGEGAKDKKAQVLAYLKENGAEHGEGVTDPETVFDGAARGDVNYVHFCLEANGEIITSSHGAEGSTLLHVAGNTGNTDLTQNLVSHGADVEARDALDRTPLMSTAMAGNVAVMRMLLTAGATLEHRDSNGNTALHHACEAGHLECVRALLSRDAPSARSGTEDAAAVAAILRGEAHEYEPPSRLLSPHELLAMKNKDGHTPVVKAFAGGVHIGVIRYVVGILDHNVDAVRCGQVDAEPPSLLSRQLCTDGIMLQPPPPPPEGEELETSGTVGGGMFACGGDGAEDEKMDEMDQKEEDREELEARERERRLAESTGVLYPVHVPPGPQSQGHRRLTRFVENIRTSVWGYDPSKVYVMSRHAVIAQEKMVPFEEAQERKLLVPLSSIPPAATLLYVSHRWAAAGQPDAQDANAQMQLKRYLEEHAGAGIHYVWLDVSCINVVDKEHAAYEQYVSNVVTVLTRSTHLLAVPPCRMLQPRTLVRDMTVARMEEKNAAAGEHPEYLKKIPSAMSMGRLGQGQGHGLSSGNSAFIAPDQGAAGGVSSKAGGAGKTSKRRVSTEAVIMHAVEEQIDDAILARKTLHPDKWSGLLNNSSSEEEKEAADVKGGGGEVEGNPGGGKASRPSNAGANGGNASVAGAGKGGGFAAPPLSGGSSSRAANGTKTKRSSVGSSTKKGGLAATGEASEVGVVDGGAGVMLTKKERRALMEQQARADAAAAAAEVTQEVTQMPSLLQEGILYSDPAALLNRGWVEMEVSLALVFGVQVLVCARWGPKVTFQTVLVKSITSEDGVTEEQASGFKGAFLHGLVPIAPDVEEAKGFVEGVKKVFVGSERPPDPTVPVRVIYAPMLEQCHEPQSVVAPLVRASLALYNEGALLAFLSGDLSPVDIMYRLSGLALQDVKDGFSGLGPLSDERDRVTLVRLYLLGLSYAMGVVPKGDKAAGKPKWQLIKDYAEAQRTINSLQSDVENLKNRTLPPPVIEQREAAPAPAPSVHGCGCVLM